MQAPQSRVAGSAQGSPDFQGGFVCDIRLPVGIGTKPIVTVDIRLDRADGVLAAFPYPLHDVSGRLHVIDGRLDVRDVTMRRGTADLTVNGAVSWPPTTHQPPGIEVDDPPADTAPAATELTTDLHVVATDVPMDDALRAALPPDSRQWLGTLGLSGQVDVDGRVFTDPLAATRPAGVGVAATVDPAPAPDADPLAAMGALDYDLLLKLHNASVAPTLNLSAGAVAATNLTGEVRVTPSRLEFRDLHGRRGPATVALAGTVELPPSPVPVVFPISPAKTSGTNSPRGAAEPSLAATSAVVHCTASAKGVPLDEGLRKLLPAAARDAWAAVRPGGAVDADFTYAGTVAADDGASTKPAVATAVATGQGAPGPAPAFAPAPAAYRLDLRPLGVSITPTVLPYRLDGCRGRVVVTPGKATLTDLTATHGPARIALAGTADTDGPLRWDARGTVADVPVDDDLRRALPAALKQRLDDVKLLGRLSVNLDHCQYIADADPDAPAAVHAVGTLHAAGASLQVGVPIEQLAGGARFDATLLGGVPQRFTAALAVDAMSLAGRSVTDLRADLDQSAGVSVPPDPSAAAGSADTVLRARRVSGVLAGGDFAGTAEVTFPAAGSPRRAGYAVDFQLRDADAHAILGSDSPSSANGLVTASLALQGDWADPTSRRGRGDVLVVGKQMAQIPLLLGLLEVTDLSLPSGNPFNEATARYAVDGNRVTFDQIQMRSPTLLMAGNGWLDFGSGRVRLNFTTDNPNLPAVPILHELWQGAKQELLQIQVRGTIKAPRVNAAALHTFTTTVDEVIHGNHAERN